MNTSIKRDNKKYDDKDLADRLIILLKSNRYNITAACKSLNISHQTYYNLKERSDYFKQQLKELDDMILDFVEQQMYKIIEKGHPSMIMYYLNKKGKSRGYTSLNEQDDNNITTININLNDE